MFHNVSLRQINIGDAFRRNPTVAAEFKLTHYDSVARVYCAVDRNGMFHEFKPKTKVYARNSQIVA
jgi:hypothetical protein